ncbi:MAG: hypothetical protein QG597_3825, partial [Actinomycetota bacterium]|nr:hypothetical protein [Actinomycetota bacterium]
GVRLRMDGDTTIGAELQFVENTEPADGAPSGHEPAAIVEWTPEPRPTPDPEIAATIGELSGLSIVAVTTLDSSPMTFLLER